MRDKQLGASARDALAPLEQQLSQPGDAGSCFAMQARGCVRRLSRRATDYRLRHPRR